MTLAAVAPNPTPPPPAAAKRQCDLCAIADGKGVRVIRFALVASLVHPQTGQRTSRGVGTILLCTRCWQNTGGKRRRMFGQLAEVDP